MNANKICLIIPSLKTGGTQRFVSYLYNFLNRDLFEVHLVLLDGEEIINSLDETNLNIHVLNLKTVKFSIFMIYKKVREIRPDIIMTFQSHLSIYFIFFKVFFSNKIKFIARESNLVSFKNKTYRFPLLQDFLYRNLICNFDKIVCQSEDMLSDLQDNYSLPKKKLIRINNPIDTAYIDSMILNSNSVAKKYDFIACASTLSPQKGLSRLIDSFSLIKDKNLTLAILGDGKSRDVLQKQIDKLGLSSNVFLLGLKNNPYKHIIASKVYVLSSFFEGFPNVLLEAGYLEKPCVSFNVKGGINEIILNGKNGFIVDGSNKLFSEILVKALDFEFDKKFIRKNIVDKFSVNKIISHYEEFFIYILN